MAIKSRIIVYSGVTAAAYIVLTIAIAPVSYGPIQFRVSEILKPLALYDPFFAFSFLVGNGLANLASPFGFWDFAIMPIVDCIAALICWRLRRLPYVALIVQAILISAGVAAFPLGMGIGLPFFPTFASVLISELFLLIVGYWTIWRKHGINFLFGWQ